MRLFFSCCCPKRYADSNTIVFRFVFVATCLLDSIAAFFFVINCENISKNDVKITSKSLNNEPWNSTKDECS